MSVEFAHVSKVEDGYAWVEKSAMASCSGCAAQSECGTSAVQKYLSKSYRTVKVTNQCGAVEGDYVAIEIADTLLLKLSVMTYFLPLCVFLGACALGHSVGGDDKNLYSIVCGFTGLVCAVVLIKVYTTWLFKRQQSPLKAIRILPNTH